MVRAKFKVDSIEDFGSSSTVKMSPVTNGSTENESFWKYTPYGSLVMNSINSDAMSDFVPGKQFYIDFTDATAVVEATPETPDQGVGTAPEVEAPVVEAPAVVAETTPPADVPAA